MSKSNPGWPPMPRPSRPAARRRASTASSASRMNRYSPRRYSQPWRAPVAKAARVMPSNTVSACSVSSTRSLKVPGSPSSALQTTWRAWPAAARARAHFSPVVNPAPPRPRRREARSSRIRPSGPRDRPAASASPGASGVPSSTSARRTWGCTCCQSAGQASGGTSVSTSSAMRAMRASSSRVTTWRWLTSSAGPWSPRPVQEVVVMLTRPSARSSPGRTCRRAHSAAINAALPAKRSVMLSENRMRNRPTGAVCRKR